MPFLAHQWSSGYATYLGCIQSLECDMPVSFQLRFFCFRYHLTLRGCRAGDSCPFRHPARQSPDLISTSSQSTGQGARILEKYSMSKNAELQGVKALIRGDLQPKIYTRVYFYLII